MNPMTRKVLTGYGLFCAVNWALTYSAARSGSPLLFGSAQLLSLNESLRPLNLLARLLDPLALAQRQSAPAAAAAAPGVLTSQAFLPDASTQTVYPTGTTTTF
jgi:hypothetical protein